MLVFITVQFIFKKVPVNRKSDFSCVNQMSLLQGCFGFFLNNKEERECTKGRKEKNTYYLQSCILLHSFWLMDLVVANV